MFTVKYDKNCPNFYICQIISLQQICWLYKVYKLYRYTTVPIKNELNEYYIDLPCNCEIIESVTANYEDYQKTTPTTLAGQNQNGWIEGYIESRKYNTGTLYSEGKYIKYRDRSRKKNCEI